MKRVPALAVLVLLAGCSRPTPEGQIVQQTPASAILEACGKATPLPASGPGRFAVRRAIDCDGGGLLRVTFTDGTEVTCPIGYVTSLRQDWSFIATKTGCRTMLDAPRAMTLRVTPTPKP